jgi:molecular chaperone Hsp33
MTSQSPDTKITFTSPVRAPSAVPVDDAVIPFEVNALDLRGRLTRMGPALDEILTKHDYPAPVGKLLGEAIVLTTLLGSSLKFDGRFILQTQTDGPVSFLIVDFQAPDRLRAYARYDVKRLAPGLDSGALLGKGHLAMTIDQGPDMSRYQGLAAGWKRPRMNISCAPSRSRPACASRSARSFAAARAASTAGAPAAS